MNTPQAALAAIFPEPVVSGPYIINPPTLLHLAAIDRLGCRLEGRIGADAAATAGYVLTRTPDELSLAMALPRDEFSRAAADWACGQRATDIEHLIDGVTRAINAAFATAVPGSDADPTPGHPQTSDGPSKSRKR